MLRTILRTGFFLCVAGITSAAEPPVHLEVALEPGGPIDGSQRWLAELKRLPWASLRLRSAAPGDRPQVERRGTADRPEYRVTALLTARNELSLPNRRFALGDSARLAAWLAELRDSQPAAEPRGSFGLTAAQLVQLARDLAPATRDSTQGVSAASAVNAIQAECKVPLVITGSARPRLRAATPITDELRGLSQGTVLAATLRPLGLALVPESAAASPVRLQVVVATEAQEAWPIGWPSQQPPPKTLPKLFDSLSIEIVDQPLDRVLAAIQPRLGVPFLIDHNGLAAQAIELDKARVNFPARRASYQRLLDRVLFQARLQMELRVDEAKRPFLWIEPLTVGRR